MFGDEDIGEVLLKLGVSLLIGTVIGGEREYKNKAAGLRTLILICLGSTLFTIISVSVGAESESGRVASNIVTGIGFLGAGAIMREGLTVSGLTTSSSIWVTAALGMAVGAGEYYLSVFATIIVLVVLTLFGYVQPLIDRYQKAIQLHITFGGIDDNMQEMEERMRHYDLRFLKTREMKKDGDSIFHYEVSGPERIIDKLLKELRENKRIRTFEY
jgi:putative Mg2+ transporter-C (MgtC) family protein